MGRDYCRRSRRNADIRQHGDGNPWDNPATTSDGDPRRSPHQVPSGRQRDLRCRKANDNLRKRSTARHNLWDAFTPAQIDTNTPHRVHAHANNNHQSYRPPKNCHPPSKRKARSIQNQLFSTTSNGCTYPPRLQPSSTPHATKRPPLARAAERQTETPPVNGGNPAPRQEETFTRKGNYGYTRRHTKENTSNRAASNQNGTRS